MRAFAYAWVAFSIFGPISAARGEGDSAEAARAAGASGAGAVEQLMPAAALARIKAALPEVEDQKLRAILKNEQTLWYDADVMAESYQDSVGASDNEHWPDLVAADESTIGGLHNRAKKRWQFPFGATAGTDDSSNIRVEHFAAFPATGGQVDTVKIKQVTRNAERPAWTWTYRPGTVFGEVLFIKDGENLLPTEIRVRTRMVDGWAMNAFRPFPEATDLAAAIKDRKPNWEGTPNLRALVHYLGDATTLKAASLRAATGLASTFSQDGYIDVLPDFKDDELVRTLLKSTPFRAAYDTAWKTNGNKVTYAASTKSKLSIVPNNYMAGLIQVTDDSCMRCHKEAGRLVSEFYDALYLYGEIWGKDGIFSFHPYDESYYPELRLQGSGVDGFQDNRHLNPKLKQMGIFATSF